MNVLLEVACALGLVHGWLHHLEGRKPGLEFETVKSTILAHLAQVRGLVWLDLEHCLEK